MDGQARARVKRVIGRALEVWPSEEDAEAFLCQPHPLFDGRRPIDMARASEVGAQAVLGILGRLIIDGVRWERGIDRAP